MQLEDHIGDILRKALIFFEREQASLVTLSGLTPEQWQQLSEHGFIQDIPPQSLPWEKIGKFFRFDPQRLQAIAEGWLPPKLEPIPLGPVSGFHHIQTAGSTSFESDSLLNTVNSYLLANSSALSFCLCFSLFKSLVSRISSRSISHLTISVVYSQIRRFSLCQCIDLRKRT